MLSSPMSLTLVLSLTCI